MSRASKITLGLAVFCATGIFYYVQYKKQTDEELMHAGVLRDQERKKRSEAEKIYLLQRQSELNTLLKNQSRDDEAVLKILEGEKKSRN